MEKSATPSISIIPPASAAGEGVEQEPVAIVLFSSRCCLCDSSKSNFVTAAPPAEDSQTGPISKAAK